MRGNRKLALAAAGVVAVGAVTGGIAIAARRRRRRRAAHRLGARPGDRGRARAHGRRHGHRDGGRRRRRRLRRRGPARRREPGRGQPGRELQGHRAGGRRRRRQVTKTKAATTTRCASCRSSSSSRRCSPAAGCGAVRGGEHDGKRGGADRFRPTPPGERAGEPRPGRLRRGDRQPVVADAPGTRWVYRETDGEGERAARRGHGDRRDEGGRGHRGTVVHDVVTENGEVIEDTYDWYAQDRPGTSGTSARRPTEYERREGRTTEGSWEAGVDGAQAGVIMPANPEVGMAFRQEYYEGEAEDAGEILSLDEQAEVPVRRLRRRPHDQGLHPARPGRPRAQVLRQGRRSGPRGQRARRLGPRGARVLRAACVQPSRVGLSASRRRRLRRGPSGSRPGRRDGRRRARWPIRPPRCRGARCSRHMLPTTAAGIPSIRTVGTPGGRIGPPTWGTLPITSGHMCGSPTRAALS